MEEEPKEEEEIIVSTRDQVAGLIRQTYRPDPPPFIPQQDNPHSSYDGDECLDPYDDEDAGFFESDFFIRLVAVLLAMGALAILGWAIWYAKTGIG